MRELLGRLNYLEFSTVKEVSRIWVPDFFKKMVASTVSCSDQTKLQRWGNIFIPPPMGASAMTINYDKSRNEPNTACGIWDETGDPPKFNFEAH